MSVTSANTTRQMTRILEGPVHLLPKEHYRLAERQLRAVELDLQDKLKNGQHLSLGDQIETEARLKIASIHAQLASVDEETL